MLVLEEKISVFCFWEGELVRGTYMRLGLWSSFRWGRCVGFWLFCCLLHCLSTMADGIRHFWPGNWSDGKRDE